MTNSKHCLIFGGSGQIGRNLIRKITKKSYQNLLFNNIISEGMMPKLHNAIEAIEGGVNEVAISTTNIINQDFPYTSITLI